MKHPLLRRSLVWSLGTSLILHAAGAAYVYVFTEAPGFDFELKRPSEVSFGVVDGAADAAVAPARSLIADSDEAGAEAADGRTAEDASQDAQKLQDEGAEGAETSATRGRASTSEAVDAQTLSKALGRDGALIVVRANMKDVRRSPLEAEVRDLLQAIPEWSTMLAGSGVNPLSDLETVSLASADLSMGSWVIAGRAVGGEATVRAATKSINAARGETTSWTDVDGVTQAPWHASDHAARVVALLSNQRFVICRPTDLPSVLALVAARSGESPLFGLHRSAPISLTVEGARHFVAGGPIVIPESMRLSIHMTEEQQVGVKLSAPFKGAAQARRALAYWEQQRQRYATNGFVILLGLSAPLEDTKLSQRGRAMHAEVEMRVDSVRSILLQVAGLLSDLNATSPRSAPP